jgi:hypothetical protein
MFARYEGVRYTLIAINIGEMIVLFWFPIDGDHVEALHSGALNLKNVPALQEVR